MSKYSYFAVVVNHDTGMAFVDDGMIAEYTDGSIYNDDACQWEYPEQGSETAQKDYKFWRDLEGAVEILNHNRA